jgi:hypothetical protein
VLSFHAGEDGTCFVWLGNFPLVFAGFAPGSAAGACFRAAATLPTAAPIFFAAPTKALSSEVCFFAIYRYATFRTQL